MFFIGTSTGRINDLPTITDQKITIDLDELKDKRRGKMDERVRISLPFPKVSFWDRSGAAASFNDDPSGLEFSLTITTKQFIGRLERIAPRDNELDRILGHNHVVELFLSIDYDKEKDEGIVTIKCGGRLIHLQNFSVD